MTIFFGTLIIVLFCCLAMGLGQIINGKSLSGGCGKKAPGSLRCGACPKRLRNKQPGNELKGESAC